LRGQFSTRKPFPQRKTLAAPCPKTTLKGTPRAAGAGAPSVDLDGKSLQIEILFDAAAQAQDRLGVELRDP
jgi:hypothetical protein